VLPTGLARAYEFGRRNRADVVNAKEVRTSGWSWGWDAFTADVPHADSVDPNPLIPMTPHKLYRRQFLLDHDITFPEGARVLWEDIYFNTLAYARGARVAVLSGYAMYHWVMGAQNTSKSFGRDIEELWSNLAAVLDYIRAHLPGAPGDALVFYQLRTRVLGFLGPRSLNRNAEQYAVAYGHARELVARYAPPARDGEMSTVDRCRVELVRADRPELQRRLAEQDRDVTAMPTVQTVAWEGAQLVLTVTATLLTGAGEPLRLRRAGDRWLRDLPAELTEVLSAPAVDVTDQLAAARFTASVKGRSSRSTWALPGTGTVACADDGTITAQVTARFAPVEFAATHDLTDRVWDFAARLEVFGYSVHRGLRGGEVTVALVDGVPAVGYVNKDGLFSLDVAAAVRTVTGSAGVPVDAAQVVAEPAGARTRVRVHAPLPTVHCAGETRLRGQVLLGPERRAAATLTGGADGAVLAFEATLPDGVHPLRTRFLDRTGATGLCLEVGAGTARLTVATAEED
jgi:hypothetical protein